MFDGDEMNTHLARTRLSEAELRELSSVTKLLVSSQNSNPFIGMKQDALLGSYLMTRDDIRINKKTLMNLLMYHDGFQGNIPEPAIKKGKDAQEDYWTGRQLTSLFIPRMNINREEPPLSGRPEDKDNNKIIIRDGQHISGQLSKKLVGGESGAIHHLAFLDYSPEEAKNFLNRLNYITINWLLKQGFTFGAKSLITPKDSVSIIKTALDKSYTRVNEQIELVNRGMLEAQLGLSIVEQFEKNVFQIVQGVATEIQKAIIPHMDKDNSILNTISAGSVGKVDNIQMISGAICQQALNGGRIPMNYKDRCLPHFYKYDQSPYARGFVNNNFLNGTDPIEFFMYMAAAREGSIDTAVKTASSGYIQRKLVKGMEDQRVHYDNTIRNSNNKIVQFLYGEDGLDPRYIEKQKMKLYGYNNVTMENKYRLTESDIKGLLKPEAVKRNNKDFNKKRIDEYTQHLYQDREDLRNIYLSRKQTEDVELPVGIIRLIDSTKSIFKINKDTKADITPMEALEKVEKLINELPNVFRNRPEDTTDTERNALILFNMLIRSNLSPKQVVVEHRLTKQALEYLLNNIRRKFVLAIVAPGYMAGPVAAQSVGEPITQSTLNTFHLAGAASASKTTRGIGRITEILSLSKKLKTEITHLNIIPEIRGNREKVYKIGADIQFCLFKEIVKSSDIWYDPEEKVIENDRKMIDDFMKYSLEENKPEGLSPWLIRYTINKEALIYQQVRMREIKKRMMDYNRNMFIIYSDDNADELIIRVKVNPVKLLEKENDLFKAVRKFEQELLENVIIKGIPNVYDVEVIERKDLVFNEQGELIRESNWGIDANGTNLMKLFGIHGIDYTQSYSNDIHEISRVVGIEAARLMIMKELEDADVKTNYHHLSLLADTMTYRGYLMSIDRHGINRSDIGPIARASFEETTDQLVNAGIWAETDSLKGVSANVMLGRLIKGGTGAFDVLVNEKYLTKSKTTEEIIDSQFD